MKRHFQQTGSLKPALSQFDLSYRKLFNCDMGQLIPVMCDEVVPGDFLKIGNETVVRFQPLIAPILHEVNVYVHYFFVPYRLLWDDWEKFITGGEDGEFSATLPKANPEDYEPFKGSLWDYFGFPLFDGEFEVVPPLEHQPLKFPFQAYGLIYNEYYRDENIIEEVDIHDNGWVEKPLNRAWEKDYFTTCLPWMQRGIAPALPISGSTSAVWTDDAIGQVLWGPLEDTYYGMQAQLVVDEEDEGEYYNIRPSQNGLPAQGMYPERDFKAVLSDNSLNENTVDLSEATTFDVNDLRLAFQVQKWLERNARAGARYTEFLKAHFGVSPHDARLDRPEYIGGSKAPVIISEVLQTNNSAEGTTPQGNMAGHGITADRQYCGKYKVEEYGLIMGIMSIMPRTAYQQGINRQWLKDTKYDFYFREFANLSEQAVTRKEIYYGFNGDSGNDVIFGYQGRYNEMRSKSDMVCGDMRDTFDYWHLGRKFSSAPALNQQFIECNSASTRRIFAVQDEPSCIVNIHNRIQAWRPMPIIPEPGFIDHN